VMVHPGTSICTKYVALMLLHLAAPVTLGKLRRWRCTQVRWSISVSHLAWMHLYKEIIPNLHQRLDHKLERARLARSSLQNPEFACKSVAIPDSLSPHTNSRQCTSSNQRRLERGNLSRTPTCASK
jgi:hypothetical protein